MNKNWIMIGLIAVLIGTLLMGNLGLFSNEVLAEGDSVVNIVSVSGVGTITVKPDVAYINVGVETEHADAGIAQEENAQKMTAVMSALEAVGIEEADIKTVQYSVYDRFDYFDDRKSDKYYVVNNVVQVTINDITAVGDVIDAATEAGANQVSSIQFGISNENEVYQEALKLAMTSAKAKANSILSTFGKTASAPSKVSETSYYSGVVRMDTSMAMAESKMSTPVSAGELTVTANVSVEYNY